MNATLNGYKYAIREEENAFVAIRNGIEGYGNTPQEACEVCEHEIMAHETGGK